MGGGSNGRKERGSSAELAIAILIASTSVFGAFVAWRAAVASNDGVHSQEQALVRQAASQEAQIRADVYVDASQLDYLRLREALARAGALSALARKSGDPQARATLLVEARAFLRAAATVRQHLDPAAITTSGALDTARIRQIYYDEEAAVVALDPGPLQASADHHNAAARRLRTLALGAIIAAFFLTLAQVARSRVWRLYFVGGLGVLLALAVDLIVTGVS